MNIQIIFIVVIIIIGITLFSVVIFESQKNDSSNISLTLKLSDSKIIDQILKEDIIGFGFVWLFLDDKFSNDGILTNIHIENGVIVDTWHNELVSTNYDSSNSFCINLQESIGTVKVENDQITSIFEPHSNFDKSKFSKNYLTVKLVNDSDCYYHIKAIILQNP